MRPDSTLHTPETASLADGATFGRDLHRSSMVLILALAVPLLALAGLVVYLLRAAERVEHADRVIAQTQLVRTLVVDGETGLRGFRMANDEVFLAPYRDALPQVDGELGKLAELIADDSAQREPVAALRKAVRAWLAFSAEALELQRADAGLIRDSAFHLRGMELMDLVRAHIDKVVSAEVRLREKRAARKDLIVKGLFTFLGLGLVAGLPWLATWHGQVLRKSTESYRAGIVAVAQQAEELRVTLHSIGDAVIATDTNGAVVLLNPVAEHLTGWSNAEARGHGLGEVLPIFNEQTGARTENPVDRVLRDGAIVGLANHTVLRPRGGGEIPIEDSAAPIRGEDGALRGVILVFRDVSVEHAAAVELADRARLSMLRADLGAVLVSPGTINANLQRACELLVRHLDAAFVRIWTLPRDGTVLELHASAGLYTHLDGPHARVPVGEFKIGRIAANREPHLTNDVTGDSNISDPEWARREGMIAFAGYPLLSDDRVLGVLALFSRHPLSAAVLDDLGPLTESLALYLARRETEDALRDAKDKAEAASRAKDNFLAALSHELRTPLTPVLMTAAALRDDGRLPAEVREQLAMIERNIALEGRLIDDLLDLTRVTEGKLPLRLRLCDAHSLISLAVEIVLDDAQAKGIAIQRDFAAKRSGLMADPARFQQVIWNLLRNSVKFTPEGGRIEICTFNPTDDGGPPRLHIEVRDDGIGIDPTVTEQIFHAFEQGGLTNDHRFGGLGLGLSIARAIVDLHGGTIRAESAGVGRGATFIIELPGALEAPHGVAVETDRIGLVVAAPATPASQRSLRLLLVEDHRATLQVLTRLLTRAGHHVTSASTVASALNIAAEGDFDAVVSDLGLPDGTGMELMRQLRDRHDLRGIALSGYGMEQDMERSREAGFFAHLVKPIDFDNLRRTLETLG